MADHAYTSNLSRRQAALGLFVAAPAAMAAFAAGTPVVAEAAGNPFGVAEYVAGWRAVAAEVVPTIRHGKFSFELRGPFTGWGSLNPNSEMARWEMSTPDMEREVFDYLVSEGIQVEV